MGDPAETGSEHVLRRRGVRLASGAVGLLVVLIVLVWFQPQALLFDRVVDEEFPGITSTPAATDGDLDVDEPDESDEPADDATATATPAPASDEPIALAVGSFESRNRYTVTGTATTYELPDGSRILRLEDFESTNGPDLFVYLTAGDQADDDATLDADFVNLGVLRGNVGNQNYDLPAEVDLSRYDTVVIWCRRFTTSFGAADLVPTA
jgi:hypothetical protein